MKIQYIYTIYIVSMVSGKVKKKNENIKNNHNTQ